MAADLGKPELEGVADRRSRRAQGHRGDPAPPRQLGGFQAPPRCRGRSALAGPRWYPEPLGAVLVIRPWNYPVRCLVLPLAFAIAAGNTVAVKPSELAPATSRALARLLPDYLDGEALKVVEGGPDVAAGLLEERWDHVFFTGSGRVGRLVMAAAARHATPVTLELGGKNPAIVDHTADAATAARRLAWGKFLNAGQTCVAPDYVLVDRRIEAQLLAELVRRVRDFYGPDPRTSPDLARIVNEAQVQRLQSLLEASKGRVVTGRDL